MMAAARSPNQIMALYARKKQKLSSPEPEPVAAQSIPPEAAPIRSYSTHPTYPFPIADLPVTSAVLRSGIAPTSAGKVMKKGDLDLVYFQPFVKAATASMLYKHLLEELPWYKVLYLARGMTINTPRYTTVFGLDEAAVFEPCDEEAAARSHVAVAGARVLSAMSKQPVPGNVYQKPPRPVPRCLRELKACVEEATKETYNFVLVNFYADGTHSISPHSDDESFLGHNPCGASLSLGGTRDFVMKHKTKKDVSTEKLALRSGDMVVMRGTTQANWLHSVPKRTGKTQTTAARINVTFRKCLNAKGSNNYSHYNVGSGPVHRFVNGSMVQSPTTA
jgi:alkylated DNA repair dioxygenase AlkB